MSGMHGINDEQLDALLKEAARSYRVPPAAPLDEMWERVEVAHFPAGDARGTPQRGWFARFRPALAIAATLVIGIGIGRLTSGSYQLVASHGQTPEVDLDTPTRPHTATAYEAATTRFLGQATALLVTLPAELRAGKADSAFVAQAGELLTTTRMLLDSPAAEEPRIKALLDDLELVLAQIARLEGSHNADELDLIHGALEQRDVLPRLRTAVAQIATDD